LRSQALDKIGRAFPGGSVRMVQTERGLNAARNAKVHIATYQTLGLDDEDTGVPSFLSRHYPDDAPFSHRHRRVPPLGLGPLVRGAAPQPGSHPHRPDRHAALQLRDPGRCNADDASITANNLAYFGEPVYEYTLIQAQEDGYLPACEIVQLQAFHRWRHLHPRAGAGPGRARTRAPAATCGPTI
jgi:type I restriction enzyme R subunit